MEKVECPTCGNSVFLVPSGATVEVRGRLDVGRCARLQNHSPGGDEIDDPLECADMEAALDTAMGAVSEAMPEQEVADSGPLTLWRDESFARRRYKRWATSRPAQVGLAGQRHRCAVRDISPGGACVALEDVAAVRPGAYVILNLEGYGGVPAEIRQVDEADELARLCFLHDDERQAALAGWLLSLPAAPVLDA